MKDKDVIQMIDRVCDEITTLRQRVAVLEPKAHAYDAITDILGLLPRPSQGYGEDIIWRLRKEQEQLMMSQPGSSEEAGT